MLHGVAHKGKQKGTMTEWMLQLSIQGTHTHRLSEILNRNSCSIFMNNTFSPTSSSAALLAGAKLHLVSKLHIVDDTKGKGVMMCNDNEIVFILYWRDGTLEVAGNQTKANIKALDQLQCHARYNNGCFIHQQLIANILLDSLVYQTYLWSSIY
jgi:hypothetical protein